MKNIDCSQIRKYKTSKDYSLLTFPELLDELKAACQDLIDYRKQMVQECNAIRKETANGRHVDEVI